MKIQENFDYFIAKNGSISLASHEKLGKQLCIHDQVEQIKVNWLCAQ